MTLIIIIQGVLTLKQNQSILEMPTDRSGVYAIFNPITKKAYVGETNDFNRRLT